MRGGAVGLPHDGVSPPVVLPGFAAPGSRGSSRIFSSVVS
jgi:hypothetical protein